jgi:hypothetical protein
MSNPCTKVSLMVWCSGRGPIMEEHGRKKGGGERRRWHSSASTSRGLYLYNRGGGEEKVVLEC